MTYLYEILIVQILNAYLIKLNNKLKRKIFKYPRHTWIFDVRHSNMNFTITE